VVMGCAESAIARSPAIIEFFVIPSNPRFVSVSHSLMR
jgi:hypothetical protein